MEENMRRAIYPGSFDPVTYGHLDIIQRASKVVDELIIGILVNKTKKPLFSMEERFSFLQETTKEFPNVTVKTFEGLTIDFESEMQIAQTNHSIAPDIDTLFFTTCLEYAFLSSTIAKEVAYYGSDVSLLVPPVVAEAFRKKYNH